MRPRNFPFVVWLAAAFGVMALLVRIRYLVPRLVYGWSSLEIALALLVVVAFGLLVWILIRARRRG